MKGKLGEWGIEAEHLLIVLVVVVVVVAGTASATVGSSDEDGVFADVEISKYLRMYAWPGDAYGEGNGTVWYRGQGGDSPQPEGSFIVDDNVKLAKDSNLISTGNLIGEKYIQLRPWNNDEDNYGTGQGKIWYNGEGGSWDNVPNSESSWIVSNGKWLVRDNEVRVDGQSPHFTLRETDSSARSRISMEEGVLSIDVYKDGSFEEILTVDSDDDKVEVKGDLNVEGDTNIDSGDSDEDEGSEGMQPPCEGSWSSISDADGDAIGYFWKCE